MEVATVILPIMKRWRFISKGWWTYTCLKQLTNPREKEQNLDGKLTWYELHWMPSKTVSKLVLTLCYASKCLVSNNQFTYMEVVLHFETTGFFFDGLRLVLGAGRFESMSILKQLYVDFTGSYMANANINKMFSGYIFVNVLFCAWHFVNQNFAMCPGRFNLIKHSRLLYVMRAG